MPGSAGSHDEEDNMDYIVKRLMELQDLKYRDFHSKLMPGIDKELVIGVRTPQLRKLAKDLVRVLAKSPAEAIEMIDMLLPYVDNWATCDLLPPKIFKKDLPLVRKSIMPWLESDQVYRVRFAIVTMLGYFLEEEFRREDLETLAKIKSEEYYINMAVAWYYSYALIKQYDETIKLFEAKTLDKWIQNKSIQKAVESYRISPERKEYLKTLKKKDD